MSNITDIKYVLTQKGLDTFCLKFHIPESVHPELPSRNQTMHERPVGNIGVYTIFFEYANFRLPLSTFLVDVLSIEPTIGLFRCFYVNSKNKRWMSFSERSDNSTVCYTKPLDSLKHWNGYFFWVDAFACPVSFPWHTDKNVSRDPLPKSTKFNVDDYAVLVAHPAPFQKFPKPFLCLVGMSRYYTLDEDTYLRFLHDNGEDMDLFAFIHVVDPTKLKIIKRDRAEGERKLLDFTVGRVVLLLPVGDPTVGRGHNAVIKPVTNVEDIAAENVTAERPKRQRKKRPAVTNLLASSILNAEVGVKAMATIYLITSLIAATPEHEDGDPTNSVTGPNLCTIGPSKRFFISSDSSHRSSTNAAEVEVDSFIRSASPLPVMTKAVVTTSIVSAPSIPVPEAAAKITPPVQHLFFMIPVLQWNVPNDTLLDDHDISWEFIDHLAPPVLFAQIREMDYHYLFTEFNVGTTRQACLHAKVRMRTEYCLSERRRLESECERQVELLKVYVFEAAEKVHADELDALKQKSDLELKDFNVTVSSLKSQNDGLVDQVHAFETTCSSLCDQVSGYDRLKEQIEEFQDAQMNIVNDKVAKLDADLMEMALYLTEKFYPHLLTTISGRSRAIEKGMQSRPSAGIDHGKEVRSLADVVAYNPAAKADYNSALQRLCEVDFPLLAELSSHKDASVEDIMNLLLLESPLKDALGMSNLQPNVEQLMLPIHRSEDQVVLGETSLSFALSVSHSRNLIGAAGTSDSVPTTVATTTALSTTFASTISVPPITIDDYEIVGADGQEDAQGNVQGNVASFPTIEFEKEELDTTP
ncbi:hypothetical protein Tco_0478929 [Tanacetum coccineum]